MKTARQAPVPVARQELGSHRPQSPKERAFGRIGQLETRLAGDESEVRAAQRARYRVFRRESRATSPEDDDRLRVDADRFDEVCDHLLVLDKAIDGPVANQVVGTYRLLTDDVATASGGFYSAGEFAVGELVQRHPAKRFMELGRSCVLPEYRTRRTLELLWQGCWAYALARGVDVMFGCASFTGADPDEHALPLSFLRRHCSAPPEWNVSALAGHYRSMDLMPAEHIAKRAALAAMPPLIKGYLRLGAMVGDGAFVDRDFVTIDIMIVLPVENINRRYLSHYGVGAERFAPSGASAATWQNGCSH